MENERVTAQQKFVRVAKEVRRGRKSPKKFKPTREGFLRQLDKQDRRCAICGERKEGESCTVAGLHPWHHPRTGLFVKVVCYHCWAVLQHLGDDPDLAERTFHFLERNIH